MIENIIMCLIFLVFKDISSHAKEHAKILMMTFQYQNCHFNIDSDKSDKLPNHASA
jgi:hypothetical protein